MQTPSHRRIMRSILAIETHLRHITSLWADCLGISSMQWMILSAVWDLDNGNGARVSEVADMTKFDRSLIMKQAKRLEVARMLRSCNETTSAFLFLTAGMRERLGAIEIARLEAQAEIFADLDDVGIEHLKNGLAALESRALVVIRRLATANASTVPE